MLLCILKPTGSEVLKTEGIWVNDSLGKGPFPLALQARAGLGSRELCPTHLTFARATDTSAPASLRGMMEIGGPPQMSPQN